MAVCRQQAVDAARAYQEALHAAWHHVSCEYDDSRPQNDAPVAAQWMADAGARSLLAAVWRTMQRVQELMLMGACLSVCAPPPHTACATKQASVLVCADDELECSAGELGLVLVSWPQSAAALLRGGDDLALWAFIARDMDPCVEENTAWPLCRVLRMRPVRSFMHAGVTTITMGGMHCCGICIAHRSPGGKWAGAGGEG